MSKSEIELAEIDVNEQEDARTKFRKKAEEQFLATHIGSSYDLHGVIGEGGMSIVYKASHKILQRVVAIKMMHSHLLWDETNIKRFQQEARSLAGLDHPNIVRVHDSGITSDDSPYIIMDYLDGVTLAQVIKVSGALPVDRCISIFLQACDALSHAHQNGIIHRDIKPSNIVLVKEDAKEVVKVVDFGIAKTSSGQESQKLTQTGEVFGSPLYMSPEQCTGNKMDQRSDIYSLGCVFYEALTGAPPLVGENVLSTLHKHMSELPKPLSIPGIDANVMERLDAMVSRMLEKEPTRRYTSVSELKNDLQRLHTDAGRRVAAKTVVFRFARARRLLQKFIHEQPIRFAAIAVGSILSAVALVGLIAIGMLFAIDTSARTVVIPWTDTIHPVSEPPLNFREKWYVVDTAVQEKGQRLGTNHPSFLDSKKKLGMFYMKYGAFGKAEKEFKELVEYESRELAKSEAPNMTLAEAYNNLGWGSLKARHYEDAKKAFAKSIEVTTTVVGAHNALNADSKLGLAQAMQQTRDYKKAISIYETCFDRQLNTDPEIRAYAASRQADCYYQLSRATGDPTEKQELLKRAFDRSYESQIKWSMLGSQDNSIAAQERCAFLSEELGNLDAAARYYDQTALRIRQIYADENKYLPSILMAQARVLAKKGDWGHSLKVREDAKRQSAMQKDISADSGL